jgi:ABC-type branched-subunit amino acid transport system ATPase component
VAATISHGEQRQLEIAMTLATEPTVLLLDEPLAGMGQAEAESMVALLQRLKKDHAMMLVEHDMDAVFSLADQLTVMVNGQVIASGRQTPSGPTRWCRPPTWGRSTDDTATDPGQRPQHPLRGQPHPARHRLHRRPGSDHRADGSQRHGQDHLLKSIMGIVKPSGGSVQIKGRAMTGATPYEVARQGSPTCQKAAAFSATSV